MNYIAFDLGATSGRTILGSIIKSKLSLKELIRFPNAMLEINGHFYWNIFALYEELIRGLDLAAEQGVEIASIGIDTWGVDFAFVGQDGALLGLPHAYRDPHTADAPKRFFREKMSQAAVYARTGIQVMNFNSLYQVYVLQQNGCSPLAASDKLLFIPDALSYMLTGQMVTEYTIASTSQMINPHTKLFDAELLGCVGLTPKHFAPIVMPGHRIGVLRKEIAQACGLPQLPVVAVAGHDTASAVAAIPAANRHFAYLSSGTWSLMGLEVDHPVISDQTAAWNITNEGGVEGTIRLLKNITGMWIVEQCLQEWKKQGITYSYAQMVEMAQRARPFVAMIDPDASCFANPQSMITAIDTYCASTSQTPPQTHGEYIRSVFESLALKYKFTLNRFRQLAGFPIETLHIIGGGSRNRLLNQFTANSTGIRVVAGPAEATAIGNIMLQAKAAGVVSDLWQMRKMIAEGIETETFTPTECENWNTAYERFQTLLS